MKDTITEYSRRAPQNKIFSTCIMFLNCLSQVLQQLRTSEFKPYVIFVKPAIQEKRETPPTPPAGEDAAAPLVSLKLIISLPKA